MVSSIYCMILFGAGPHTVLGFGSRFGSGVVYGFGENRCEEKGRPTRWLAALFAVADCVVYCCGMLIDGKPV